MTTVRSRARKGLSLSSHKSQELLGVVLGAVVILFAASLLSFHPQDPSFFHQPQAETPVRNWIGPAGAQVAALHFALMGPAALLVPVIIGIVAWRRLTVFAAEPVKGRGLGVAFVLVSLPGGCQILIGTTTWRGVELDAGGVAGVLISDLLIAKLNFGGAFLVLFTALLIGTSLAVQRADFMVALRAHLWNAWDYLKGMGRFTIREVHASPPSSSAAGPAPATDLTKIRERARKTPIPSEENMPVAAHRPQLKVFLCHASLDKPKVRVLYDYISSLGVDVWFDEKSLLPGQNWEMEIQRAITQSNLVIVCLSPQAVKKVGYVHKEIKSIIDRADEHPEDDIYVVPVKLEECQVPRSLARWHYVNLWEKDGRKKLAQLLRSRALEIQRAPEFSKE